jgi:signal transduction histidine kinase
MLRPYLAALHRYLQQGSSASLLPASRLGRRAMTRGLEILDLALLHEQALLTQVLPVIDPAVRDQTIRRARAFFAEAILPLEETHRSAREANLRLGRMNLALSRRTRELAVSSRQLRLLSHRVLSAQEEERKRISRELHDVIAQMLTGINVRLETLKVEATAKPRGLSRKITRTQRLVEKSVDIVHRFARELRPVVLDDLGLIPALHAFLKCFAKETGIPIHLTAFAAVETLSSAKRTVLYRVAQEALSNVARHAHASRVNVDIHKIQDAACMAIQDDGRSFQVDRVLQSRRYKRLGLLGMRERVEMVGGRFRVESSPGHGTTIHIEIPFTNKTRSIVPRKEIL